MQELQDETKTGIRNQLFELKENFTELVNLGVGFRKEQLLNLKKGLEENRDEILESLDKDLGMDKLTGYSCIYFDLFAQIDLMLDQLDDWVKPREVGATTCALPSHSYIEAQPRGVYLIYGAWNFQYNVVIGPLLACIAAGNCAFIRPSELAPETSKVLSKLIANYLDNRFYKAIGNEYGNAETSSF